MRAYGIALAILAGLPPAGAKTVYVNRNAPGATRDGASWSTAFLTVQQGLNAAASSDEVWVAAAAPGAPAYVERITMPNGVALYGGFRGSETARGQRDARANETVLDGEKGGTVVTIPSSVTQTVTVDGFTVRNGYVAGGAGMNVNGKAVISNNVITANQATGFGGGIFVGGGIVTIANNIVGGNRATYGGGIEVYSGTVTLVNNLVVGNTASYGGGIYATAALTVIGNTIVGNSATYGGGLLYYTNKTVTVANSIIAFNSNGILRLDGTLSLRNCDVCLNTAYNYSGVADQTGTNGNISSDPLMVDRQKGDYRLLTGSPCIDTGDDGAVAAGEKDLDGKPRIIGPHVDRGAYEYGTVVQAYTLEDATKCLGISAGLSSVTSTDLSRLNVEASSPALDISDALRLARKVAGLEPNP